MVSNTAYLPNHAYSQADNLNHIIKLLQDFAINDINYEKQQKDNIIYHKNGNEAADKLQKFQWAYEDQLMHYYKMLVNPMGSQPNLPNPSMGQTGISNQVTEDNLPEPLSTTVTNNFVKQRRSAVINNFKKFIAADHNNKIESFINKLKNYEAQIKSRLQWQGHNKELQAILPEEQEKMEEILDLIEKERSKRQVVLDKVENIINYESYRSIGSREGAYFDSKAYTAVCDCIQLSQDLKKQQSHIVESLKSGVVAQTHHFNKTEILFGKYLSTKNNENKTISDYLDHLEENLEKAEESLKEKKIKFKSKSEQVSSLILKQAKLFETVRQQLKQMQNISSNENENKAQNIEKTFREISKEMLNFVRNFEGGTVSDRAIGEQTTENNISSWSQKLSNLYVELEELQFSVKAKNKNIQAAANSDSSAGLSTSTANKPENWQAPGSGREKIIGKLSTKDQANQQARKVLDKIEYKLTKLEGMATVERLVEEAMNVGNLSKLYEGWTSWV